MYHLSIFKLSMGNTNSKDKTKCDKYSVVHDS